MERSGGEVVKSSFVLGWLSRNASLPILYSPSSILRGRVGHVCTSRSAVSRNTNVNHPRIPRCYTHALADSPKSFLKCNE